MEVRICSPLCQVRAGIHVTSPETSKEYLLKVGLHNQITYLHSSLLGLSSLDIHFSSLLNIFFVHHLFLSKLKLEYFFREFLMHCSQKIGKTILSQAWLSLPCRIPKLFLKHHLTPFFQASRYEMEPEFCVINVSTW